VENAVAPIASAPTIAAVMRPFDLKMDMSSPCLPRLAGASLGQPLQMNRFRTFARNRQNGFVALGNCFVNISWRP
jgi:hypothetical protein